MIGGDIDHQLLAAVSVKIACGQRHIAHGLERLHIGYARAAFDLRRPSGKTFVRFILIVYRGII